MPITRLNAEQQHRIAMLIYPGVSTVDVCGPLECFGLANYVAGKPRYDIITVSADGLPLASAGGWLLLTPTHSFANAPQCIDTLMIAGGPAFGAASADKALLAWIRTRGRAAQRVASVCNAAAILAATGLADDCRLATHWLYTGMLARANPQVNVDPDAIFVEDGKVWSSGGMTSGMDLALAMIERDLGRTLALEVARHMVLTLKRAGGQSQFSMHLKAQFNELPSVARIQQWIIDNPGGDLRVEAIADRHAMSKRSLLRLFADHTPSTLGDFISETRLRYACSLLENTPKPFKEVAAQSGLGSEANMRKIFAAKIGVTPSQYRNKFRASEQIATATAHYDEFWLSRSDVMGPEKRAAAS